MKDAEAEMQVKHFNGGNRTQTEHTTTGDAGTRWSLIQSEVQRRWVIKNNPEPEREPRDKDWNRTDADSNRITHKGHQTTIWQT